jgi:hypothetical protein
MLIDGKPSLIEAQKQWAREFVELQDWIAEQFEYGKQLRDECDRISAHASFLIKGFGGETA